MTIKYLIRLDDACPTMAHNQWNKVYDVLRGYGVMPIVGVIPQNQDIAMQHCPEDKQFWEMMQQWQEDGATIAMHGFEHLYISDEGGVNPVWKRSEFAGVPYHTQKKKIEEGYKTLIAHGLKPKVFFAPGHTFDETTLECLKKFTPIRVVCDTVAFSPYKEDDIVFVPQQFGRLHKICVSGVWTFCLHPNVMSDNDIVKLEKFISKHRKRFVSFSELDLREVGKKTWADKLLSKTYFNLRKAKG